MSFEIGGEKRDFSTLKLALWQFPEASELLARNNPRLARHNCLASRGEHLKGGD